ncbi:hypothetical protein Q4Q99_14350 [Morganella morganii]
MKIHEMSPAVQEISAKTLSEAVLKETEFDIGNKQYSESLEKAEEIAKIIRLSFEKLYE